MRTSSHAFFLLRTYVCESLRSPTSTTARPGVCDSKGGEGGPRSWAGGAAGPGTWEAGASCALLGGCVYAAAHARMRSLLCWTTPQRSQRQASAAHECWNLAALRPSMPGPRPASSKSCIMFGSTATPGPVLLWWAVKSCPAWGAPPTLPYFCCSSSTSAFSSRRISSAMALPSISSVAWWGGREVRAGVQRARQMGSPIAGRGGWSCKGHAAQPYAGTGLTAADSDRKRVRTCLCVASYCHRPQPAVGQRALTCRHGDGHQAAGGGAALLADAPNSGTGGKCHWALHLLAGCLGKQHCAAGERHSH